MKAMPMLAICFCLVAAGAAAGPVAAGDTAGAPRTAFRLEAPTPAVDRDVSVLLGRAPSQNDYPGADAVLLDREITYTIDAQGCLSRRVHQLTKVFSEWAVRNLGDLRLGWNASDQVLTVHVCRTIRQDGTVVDTPPYGFNEVTPYAVDRCGDFLDQREMVVSHVGIERNAILELDYEVTDLAPGPMPPSGREYLQAEWPLLHATVGVEVPDSASLLWTSGNGAPQPTTELGPSGQKRLSWTVHDVPGLPLEDNQGHRADYLPYVLFSTETAWSALAARLQRLTEDAADINEAMRDWLAQDSPSGDDEIQDLTTLDKVQRIARLVGARTRSVDLGEASWRRLPRPASRVFGSSYGTRWEKGILALSLLRAAGLQPELAFFSQSDAWPRDVATALSFGTVRVVVPVGDEHLWLDPEVERAAVGRCDLAGKTGLFLENSQGQYRTYVVPPVEGKTALAVDICPDADGCYRAEIDLAVRGPLWDMTQDVTADQVAKQLAETILVDGEVVSTQTYEFSPRGLHLRLTARGSGLGTNLGQSGPAASAERSDAPGTGAWTGRRLPPRATSRAAPSWCRCPVPREMCWGPCRPGFATVPAAAGHLFSWSHR
jgi:hypothetical protein